MEDMRPARQFVSTGPQKSPEFASVDAFATYLYDDDRETYTVDELARLAFFTRRSNLSLIDELSGYCLRLAPREPVRRVRGFTTSSNDRWFGPGSGA
jgi:hypothetical protein